MKRFYILPISICLLLLVGSCGSDDNMRPTAGSIDDFMEKLSLRIDLADQSFDTFTIGIPKEPSSGAGMFASVLHKNMVKNLKEERTKMAKISTFEIDKETKKLSEDLKQAGVDLIDAYIEGAEDELRRTKNLVTKGASMQTPRVVELLGEFDARINEKIMAYSKIQKELAEMYDIILY